MEHSHLNIMPVFEILSLVKMKELKILLMCKEEHVQIPKALIPGSYNPGISSLLAFLSSVS